MYFLVTKPQFIAVVTLLALYTCVFLYFTYVLVKVSKK